MLSTGHPYRDRAGKNPSHTHFLLTYTEFQASKHTNNNKKKPILQLLGCVASLLAYSIMSLTTHMKACNKLVGCSSPSWDFFSSFSMLFKTISCYARFGTTRLIPCSLPGTCIFSNDSFHSFISFSCHYSVCPT